MPSSHLILCRPLFLLLQYFPASGSFLMSWLFVSGGQSIGVSSFSLSPSNEYLGLMSFRIDWFALSAVQGTCKSLLQHHSSKASILQLSVFFMVQCLHPYMITGKTIALTRWTFVRKIMTLLHFLASGLRPSIFIFSFQGKAAPFYQPVSCLYDGDLTAFFHFVLFSSPIFQ